MQEYFLWGMGGILDLIFSVCNRDTVCILKA